MYIYLYFIVNDLVAPNGGLTKKYVARIDNYKEVWFDFFVKKHEQVYIPSGNLTQLWKITMFTW